MLVNETDKLDFENLYRKYGNSVLKYAKSLVNHQQNAEDLAHNAWLYMAEHFHKFHFANEDLFKTYILTVVKNRSTSFHRRQTKEMELFEDMSDDSIGNLMDDCEELLFAYCENNPVNYKDPSGYGPVGTIIGGILGFGLGALLVPRVADLLKLKGERR